MPKFLKDSHGDGSDAKLVTQSSPEALVAYGTPRLPLIEDDLDLVPLLRQATNEELAPLVAYIIEKGGLSSDLQSTQRYIQYSPNHQMYADDIAAEIQRFGANTIATMFREGRGKCYREILVRTARTHLING